MLGVPVAAGNKKRVSDTEVVIDMIVGDVDGKRAIVLDEEVATGGSIMELLERLRERGVKEVSLVCAHGLFTGSAAEKFNAQPDVVEVVTTDTIPRRHADMPRLQVLSIAPLLGEAIRRIHLGESVSSLFASPEWTGTAVRETGA